MVPEKELQKTLDKRYNESQKKNYELTSPSKVHYQKTSQYGLTPGDDRFQEEYRTHVTTTPRSYVTETLLGQVRRNRTHLRIQSDFQESTSNVFTSIPSRVVTRSQIALGVKKVQDQSEAAL